MLVEAHVLVEAVHPISAPIVSLEFKGPNLREFLSGQIQYELSKRILDNLRHKYHIPLEFILEVPLSMD